MLVNMSPHLMAVYPAQYHILPSMISSLQLEEQVWRSKKFALGTLLYELYTGERIFDRQSDIKVQNQYCGAATFLNLELLPTFIQHDESCCGICSCRVAGIN